MKRQLGWPGGFIFMSPLHNCNVTGTLPLSAPSPLKAVLEIVTASVYEVELCTPSHNFSWHATSSHSLPLLVICVQGNVNHCPAKEPSSLQQLPPTPKKPLVSVALGAWLWGGEIERCGKDQNPHK